MTSRSARRAAGRATRRSTPRRPCRPRLTNGASYYLELSTTAGTVYYAWAIRKGTSYGYDPATYFNDGYAEKSANGSTWTSLGRVANQNDLQFYFGTA